jgi:hypothetical protein
MVRRHGVYRQLGHVGVVTDSENMRAVEESMNGTRTASEALKDYESSDGASEKLAHVLRELLGCMQRTEKLAQRACTSAEATASAMTRLHDEFDELRSEVRTIGDIALVSSDAAVKAQDGVAAAVEYVRQHTKATLSETPSSPELPFAKRKTDATSHGSPTDVSPYESDSPKAGPADKPTRAPSLGDLAEALTRSSVPPKP